MHRSTILVTLVPLFMLALGGSGNTRAATFRFDLTDVVGGDFDTPSNTEVDLGVSFQHIESAKLEISGIFTPGLGIPVTLPPGVNPPEPVGNVNLVISLGDLTVQKSAYALHTVFGDTGSVQFELPLLHIEDPGAPIIVPTGSGPPDYSFLLDGQFEVHAWNYFLVAGLYSIVEEPRFELTQMTLRVNGAAIPEPTTAALTIVGLFAACGGLSLRKKLLAGRPR